MAPNSKDIVLVEAPFSEYRESDERVSSKNMTSYDDALVKIGFGRVQLRVLLVACLFWMTSVSETMGVSFLVPASKCDFNLTTADKGLLSAMTIFGLMASSHLWGFLSDTQGRRIVMLYTLTASTFFSVSSAFVQNFTLFLVCRFLVGFFVSAVSSTIYSYIGEFNTVKNRSTCLSWASIAVGFAATFMPLSAWGMLSFDWSINLYGDFLFRPWRVLIIIYVVPGILGGIILFYMPESPKYLLAQGEDEKALKIVRWMFLTNNPKKEAGDFKVEHLIPEVLIDHQPLKGGNKESISILKSMWNQTIPLFKPPYLKHFATVSTLQFGCIAVSGGMGLWYPEIMNRATQSDLADNDLTICGLLGSRKASGNATSSALECDDSISNKVFIDNITLGLVYIGAYIVLALIVKPLGAGRVLASSLVLSGVCGYFLLVISNTTLLTVFFIPFMVFSGMCAALINGAAVNLFPTHLRTMAVCITMFFGRGGSAIATNTLGFLIELSCQSTFVVFASISVGAGLLSLTLPYR